MRPLNQYFRMGVTTKLYYDVRAWHPESPTQSEIAGSTPGFVQDMEKLENLENWIMFGKSQGKPGKVNYFCLLILH